MASTFLTQQVVGTSFRFYTDDEVRRISCKRVTNPVTFDSFNHPTPDGLYDKALGPTDFGVLCPTCGLAFQECPGHMGHVELSVPVFNPTLFPLLFRLLRLKCYSCHHFRIAASRSRLLKVKLMLLDCGRVQDAMELDTRVLARPEAVTELASSAAAGKKAKRSEGISADEEDVARQQRVLADLEVDCIAECGPDVGCGLGSKGGCHQYSQHVRQYRQEIVSEFLRSFPTKQCANCGALSLPIRKDGFSKIFQQPLNRRSASAMSALGIEYRSGTGVLRARAAAARKQQAAAAAAAGKNRSASNAAAAAFDDDEDNVDDVDVPSTFDIDGAAPADEAVEDGTDGEDLMGGGHDNAGGDEDDDEEGGGSRAPKPRFMPASEVAAQMQLLWEQESELLRRVFMPVKQDGTLQRHKATVKGQPTHQRQQQQQNAGHADGWRNLFLRVLSIPPPRFRPPTKLGDQQFEHPQNIYLSKIIRLNDTLVDLGLGTRTGRQANMRGGVDLKQALSTWMELQNCVNGLMDSTKVQTNGGTEAPNGIRQMLEKKEGMFRKNMMGKRVNYAARTVISPDPFLRVDQVGVPLRFAKRLHFKQPVTQWNLHALRSAVINGPDLWPGATHVEEENGTIIDLSTKTKEQREAIAKRLGTPSPECYTSTDVSNNKLAIAHASEVDAGAAAAVASAGGLPGVGIRRVWRHLQDGDVVLMNRQPTLHKPSIMAHRARVMKAWSSQQILRFHYANCKTYNADFDGDEMNMHLPQDELGRAEAETIVANEYQYLSATGGAPLRGLIQDHNAICALLTKRDAFLTKDQYCQLVFASLQALPQYAVTSSGKRDTAFGIGIGTAPMDIPFVPPAILAPRRLWTGKQVVTTLLRALTAHLPPSARSLHMDGKAKIGDGIWGLGGGRKDVIPIGDSTVTVRSNELLTGVMDKNALGNSSYGLVHVVYEVYGPKMAGALLSAFGRLLTVYQQGTAMTCGMSDLVLTPEAEAKRYALLAKGRESGAAASASFAGIKPPPEGVSVLGAPSWDRNVRRRIRDKLRGGAAGADSTGAAAFAAAVHLDNTVKSSAAQTHSSVIDACLPYGLLKPFPSNQFSLMVTSGAKGSLVNHAMIAVGLGQQELEGRRVPMMTSGKSLPCFPAFDPAPRAGGYIADRFLTGLHPQEYFFHCMSGREGLVDTAVKTSRSGYLQRCLIKHLEALRVHYDGSVRDSDGGMVQTMYGEDGIDVLSTPYAGGKDDQLGFLARNNGALASAYAMSDPVFRRAMSTMEQGGAGDAHQRLVAVRSLREGKVSIDALPALLPTLALSKGDTVEVRLPVEIGQAKWPAPSSSTSSVAKGRSLVGGDVSVDGRHYFIASNMSSRYTTATVSKVRGGAGSDEDGEGVSGTPSVDLKFTISRPVDIPGAGAARTGRIADDDEAVTSSAGGKVTGTAYVQYAVKAKHVPLALAADGSAGIVVVIKPRLPDPSMTTLSPATHLGCIPESLLDKISGYIARNPHALIRAPGPAGAGAASSSSGVKAIPGASGAMSAVAFNLLLWVKAMRAMVHPGEPVGVIAGQSIGEPSTQMTLNTFHLAGGGGVNVTLGIPRLREIVMTASPHPKTPQMSLPIVTALDGDKEPASVRAREIAGRISRMLSPLPMADLLAVQRGDGGISVSETLRPLGGMDAGGDRMWVREYAVRLCIADLDAISVAFGLSFRDVAEAVGRVFAPKLLQIIKADLAKAQRAAGSSKAADVGVERARGMRGAAGGAGRGDDDEEGGDAGEGDDQKQAKGGRGGAKASKKSAAAARGGDDSDDDEDGDGDEGADTKDEDGTAARDGKKEMSGYDDVDEEELDSEKEGSDDDDGAAKKKKKHKHHRKGKAGESSDDSDDDDAASVASSTSASSSSSSGSSSSSSSNSSSSSSGTSSNSDSDKASDDEGDGSSSVDSDAFVRRRKGAKGKASTKAKAGDAKKAKPSGKAAKASSKKSKVRFVNGEAADSDEEGGQAKKKSKGRLTAKRMVADRAAAGMDDDFSGKGSSGGMRKLAPGLFTVEVPESLNKDSRFGGITACDPREAFAEVSGGSADPWVQVSIVFPASARKVLMLSSAERTSRIAMVKNIKGLSRALVAKQRLAKGAAERTCVVTEGVNLEAIWTLAAELSVGSMGLQDSAASSSSPSSSPYQPVVDVNRLQTNDIHAVLMAYGVEAARACIVKEMRAVFDAYGIGVDIRHLYLIADYMTQGGGFRPMNRAGIEAHGSPYLKMTFETTTKFLTDAILAGEHERMVSPSARIVMGRIVDSGTGAFDLWLPMHANPPTQ